MAHTKATTQGGKSGRIVAGIDMALIEAGTVGLDCGETCIQFGKARA